LKNTVLILAFLLASCIEKEPIVKDQFPDINLANAYTISNSEIDIFGNILVDNLKTNVEYGIVWSEKINPTVQDQKLKVGSITRGGRFNTKLNSLKRGSKIFIRAYLQNSEGLINYSNEIEVIVEIPKYWRRMGDLKFDEGQFTGVAIKLNDYNLTFLRLNENNDWEQYYHYNGIWYDPEFTWEKQKYSFPQFSPRLDPLFFTLNLSKEYTQPTAFLGGGYTITPQMPNVKNYLKDMYWVYPVQNYLDPLPFENGPIAHFTLNRNEYFLEENNTEKFWGYFSLEQFIAKKPFPKLSGDYDLLGVSSKESGYILAQKTDETEVLLFEYDEKTDSWSKKANFPNNGRLDGVAFSYKNKIYYGLGRNSKPIKGLSDIWEFDPETNKWRFYTKYPGAGNLKVMASDLGDYAILFGGYQVRESNVGAEKYFPANDTWQFLK
jgi:hypothetical protein